MYSGLAYIIYSGFDHNCIAVSPIKHFVSCICILRFLNKLLTLPLYLFHTVNVITFQGSHDFSAIFNVHFFFQSELMCCFSGQSVIQSFCQEGKSGFHMLVLLIEPWHSFLKSFSVQWNSHVQLYGISADCKAGSITLNMQTKCSTKWSCLLFFLFFQLIWSVCSLVGEM